MQTALLSGIVFVTLGIPAAISSPLIAPVQFTSQVFVQVTVAPFTYVPPPPPDRGSPITSDRGGGSRGNCPTGAYPLTALVPAVSAYGGQTINPRPTLWIALPYALTPDIRVELLIRATSGQQVYRGALAPDSTPADGLVGIPFPAEAPDLEPGAYYDWYALIYCDISQRRNTPMFVSGWVQRVIAADTLGTDLSAIEAMSAADQSRQYAAQGWWYDALETLAVPMAASPPSAEIMVHWSELLHTVGLGEFSQEAVFLLAPPAGDQ